MTKRVSTISSVPWLNSRRMVSSIALPLLQYTYTNCLNQESKNTSNLRHQINPDNLQEPVKLTPSIQPRQPSPNIGVQLGGSGGGQLTKMVTRNLERATSLISMTAQETSSSLVLPLALLEVKMKNAIRTTNCTIASFLCHDFSVPPVARPQFTQHPVTLDPTTHTP